MKKLILIISALIFSVNIIAQDRLFLRNGEKLLVKVIDFSSTEVSYQLYKHADNSTYMIKASAVDKIIFKSGLVEEFFPIPGTPAFEEGPEFEITVTYPGFSYRYAIEVEPLSLAWGVLGLNYEYAIRRGLGFDVKVGVIGIGGLFEHEGYNYSYGDDDHYRSFQAERPRGFWLRTGAKLTFLKQNPLKGWYWKPEVFYGRYWENGVVKRKYTASESNPYPSYDFASNYTRNYNTFGAMVNIGYQTVFSERFTFDIYFGTGRAFYIDRAKDELSGILPEHGYNTQVYRERIPMFDTQYSHFRAGLIDFNGGVGFGYLIK